MGLLGEWRCVFSFERGRRCADESVCTGTNSIQFDWRFPRRLIYNVVNSPHYKPPPPQSVPPSLTHAPPILLPLIIIVIIVLLLYLLLIVTPMMRLSR